jgi:uncharacterized protein (DUF1330 family)
MPAYLVVEVTIEDDSRYDEYRRLVPGIIEKFGGRYLARGGATDVLEGDWNPERLVIVEFPNARQARAWWESAEYSAAKAIRQACSRARLVVVEGV